LKKNANKVNNAIKKVVGEKGKKAGAECPEEAKEEDKAEFAKNEAPTCAVIEPENEETWGIVPGMILEDDFKEDALTIVFFTLTGKFPEDLEEAEEGEGPFFAVKLV
jgi:hypothetical protein